jgi:aryl-alcohol dehydrogenase-like predicted oxidoreductase
MEYRTHRNETLPEIGVGCYALSGVYGKVDPEQFSSVLRRAYELGVTFFDTADVYGSAEEVLGQAVAPFRDQVWIATKVGGRADAKPDCSAEHVIASCETSLHRLQTDYIDLYQVHFDDPSTPVGETVEALGRLRSEGKIRHYGVGHLSPSRMEAYLQNGDVFSTLVELSAAARGSRRCLIPLCREHGVGVIAFSVTGRGLLTGKIGPDHRFEEGDIRQVDPLFRRERLASALRLVERFRALGRTYDKTPVQVAVAWALAQPGVLCALTGPSTIAHLEENLGGSGWEIAPQDLEELEQVFREEDERVRREQVQAVRAILTGELDAESAFADLVYVCETLIEQGIVAEGELLPLFQDLWALRGQSDAQAVQRMRAIQAELRNRFLPIRESSDETGEGDPEK